jgi:phosphatidylinositol alpha-1,6-mannosyltransferase
VLILAPPVTGAGGIQRYVLTLTRAVEDLFGKECVRFVSLNLPSGLTLPASRREVVGAKLRFIAAALREAAAWHPNLVVCAHVGIAPLAWLLRATTGAPYWVMAYGIEVWGRLSGLNHRSLARADRVVAISEFTRAQLVRLQGVVPERTCLLPPCLDAEWVAEALPFSGRQRRLTLLTVSRLSSAERYKGHDVVLQALKRVLRDVPAAQYVIVGDGDDRPRLEDLVRNMDLTDAVRFSGAVSAQELKICYRDCDVFVMPARTTLDKLAPKGEGFGIVFLEAMAYGKPVIAPASGAPSEFIHNGEHGLLVNPEDPAEVASALIELFTSPERARRMGEASREWVQREYSYARFCERLRGLFESSDREASREVQCAS